VVNATPPPAAPAAPPLVTGPMMGGKPAGPGAMPTQPIGIGGDGDGANGPASAAAASPATRGTPGAMPPQGMARQDGLYGRAGSIPGRRYSGRGSAYGRSRPPITYDAPQPGTRALQPGQAPPGTGPKEGTPPPPAPPVPAPADPGNGSDSDTGAAPPPPEPDPGTPQDDGSGSQTESQPEDGGSEH
jgi:hypothetical protein